MDGFKMKIPPLIKDNFRYYTLSFLFIIAYVNIFQMMFGAENSIVGVIFAVMMSASMVRDLTATPWKHLLVQAFVLVGMALSAFLVVTLPPIPAFVINFITIFFILYAYTYEYASHIYFPYILSYLFLVFISPAGAEGLPKRLLGMLAGAVSIILYQLYMGRNRVVETARDVLCDLIDEACAGIGFALDKKGEKPDMERIRHKLCLLSRTVYDRRKKVLCVSEASFSMIDAGHALEHLMILVQEMGDITSESEKKLLRWVLEQMKQYRLFLQQETETLPDPVYPDFPKKDAPAELFYHTIAYLRDRMLRMTDPEKKTHYRKTMLSLKLQLQAALDISYVRVIYALRVALLLSFATLLVQYFQLPHGRWLLFTLASVSLPYADDVPLKMKKRIAATLIGGLASVIIYSAIPFPAGRTAAMMLSGYLSFYLSDYTGTFACSTVGALGGAVFMEAFGLKEVGSVFLIRVGYICIGAVLAYLMNCLFFPYKRVNATCHLWKRYRTVVSLLTKVCQDKYADPQLYYNLVIQAHLQEDKLRENAKEGELEQIPQMLAQCREKVRSAHRKHIEGKENEPVFEIGHISGSQTAVME